MANKRKDEIHKSVVGALQKVGHDLTNAPAVADYVYQELQASGVIKADPLAGARPSTGWLYDNGPFTLIEEDIISEAVPGNPPLGSWLPSRRTTSRFQTVSHLEWVAPAGFTGAQTYADWLSGITIDDCGYGPSTAWSGFSYQMGLGSFSWTTSKMKVYPDGGVKYHDRAPMYTLRGSNIGQPLSSDREWAVARVLIAMSHHLDYVLKFGNSMNSPMEWDGILQILQPGYVQARVIGSGVPTWADPLIVNGAPISTAAQLATAIRVTIRRLRNRYRQRNWAIAPGDMVVYLSSTMWDNIIETIASGAFYSYTNAHGFDGNMSFRDYRAEIADIRAGGIGFGVMDIDGDPVPVLPDPNMGMNVTIDPSGTPKAGIAGDVAILTRRAGGMTLLEQMYLDWDQLDYPTGAVDEDTFTLQNGLVRAGWITEAAKCFYYYAEMMGGLMSYWQPGQAVIRNVVIPTLDTDENESTSFASPDYYPYNGQPGGTGLTLLNPV